MNDFCWPLAGLLLAVSVSTQAADPLAVYGKGGTNPATMACTSCHDTEGEGQKAGEDYVLPPLWGADSFNWGAGMHRINTAAAFIKENMPLGKGTSLSNEDAWHVAAFMNSHERPQDPRLIDGSIEKTRDKYHANDGVNLYGKTVNGQVPGKGL